MTSIVVWAQGKSLLSICFLFYLSTIFNYILGSFHTPETAPWPNHNTERPMPTSHCSWGGWQVGRRDGGGCMTDKERWETPAGGCLPGTHPQTSIICHVTAGTPCSPNAAHARAPHTPMTQEPTRQDGTRRRQPEEQRWGRLA
jgi:hypothetical protein